MKLQWPWTRMAAQISYMSDAINALEDVIQEKRLANFIRIREYKKGMDSEYYRDDVLNPISLEDLERRIMVLEGFAGVSRDPGHPGR